MPQDLLDRRVEITGPTTRKMIVNALNSGASVFMADFEDALSPTWDNVMEGQVNLLDLWLGQIDFTDPESGKEYKLGANPAVLIVRPRGWHLTEDHILVDGSPAAGAFVDFGLYFFHNAKRALEKGSGPYFYLPKMESHLEARLWNEVFVRAQNALGLPVGTIKATALIETLPAAFEMDEILYEMRDHIVGLNCGRWDYIFSFIKTLRAKPEFLLPDRGQVVMGKKFLAAYAALLVKTSHRRGAFAMGGMAAFIPNRRDPEVTEKALAAVREDKLREVTEGHDGTWVAHPDLVGVAKQVFDEKMPQPNQLDRLRADVSVGQMDLLAVHEGTKTEAGLRDEYPRRRAIYRGLAARKWRGAALQSDGRRRHGRNLAHAGVAVDQIRRTARRRPHRYAGAVRGSAEGRDGHASRHARRQRRSTAVASVRP